MTENMFFNYKLAKKVHKIDYSTINVYELHSVMLWLFLRYQQDPNNEILLTQIRSVYSKFKGAKDIHRTVRSLFKPKDEEATPFFTKKEHQDYLSFIANEWNQNAGSDAHWEIINSIRQINY